MIISPDRSPTSMFFTKYIPQTMMENEQKKVDNKHTFKLELDKWKKSTVYYVSVYDEKDMLIGYLSSQ